MEEYTDLCIYTHAHFIYTSYISCIRHIYNILYNIYIVIVDKYILYQFFVIVFVYTLD